MKLILTGGCTGGHIYPALAIGDEFREKEQGSEILYLGHEEGMERYIFPKYGYDLKYVRSKWVDRKNIFKMVDTCWNNLVGITQAKKIMKEFKPDFVMSTGSFVSVPVVLAAHQLKIPVYIHEQNAFPGMANKFLSRYARKVFLGFENAAPHFDKEKIVYSGNPVRKEFGENDRTAARKKLGIPENDFAFWNWKRLS